MKDNSSAIAPSSLPLSPTSTARSGLAWGLIGVLAFSFTLPLTRIAVGGADTAGGLDPLFVGAGRAVVAAALAALVLLIFRVPFPDAGQWARLIPVSAGVVVGFPVLTSLAMRETTAGHAAVVIGLLPAATAVVAVLLTHERPSSRFWLGVGLGVIATAAFSVAAHGSVAGGGISDVYLAAAVVLGAVGYAQGGRMSRELGSWQTICWALILAFPLMALLSARSYHLRPPVDVTDDQWLAFAYVSAISMFLGFFAWYRGLAIGPMTAVSQVQLVQPVLSLAWSALLVGEHLTVTLVVGAVAVVGATAFTVRSRVGSSAGPAAPEVRTAGPWASGVSGADPAAPEVPSAGPAAPGVPSAVPAAPEVSGAGPWASEVHSARSSATPGPGATSREPGAWPAPRDPRALSASRNPRALAASGDTADARPA